MRIHIQGKKAEEKYGDFGSARDDEGNYQHPRLVTFSEGDRKPMSLPEVL